MLLHVNGWTIIDNKMRKKSIRHTEIAEKLGVTPAAISHIKNGKQLLNSAQMKTIIKYLSFNDEDVSNFYTELFNARMGVKEDENTSFQVIHNNKITENDISPTVERKIPLANLSELNDYEFAFENLYLFVKSNSIKYLKMRDSDPNLCAVRIDKKNNDLKIQVGFILLVHARRYPTVGELCLLGRSDGVFMLKNYYPEENKVIFSSPFEDSDDDFIWEKKNNPYFICWCHPVKEIILKYNI